MIDYRGRIPEDIEDEIKRRITFANFLSLFTPFKSKEGGKRRQVICPKCGSKQCHCYDNGAEQCAVVCFSCGFKADALKAAQEVLGLDYHDALLHYAEEAGMQLDTDTDKDEEKLKDEEAKRIKAKKEEKYRPANEPPTYINPERIAACASRFKDTTLHRYITETLGFDAAKVEEVALRYAVGGVEVDRWSDPVPVVFPYADHLGNVCNAKVMGYREDGHRFKYTDQRGEPAALMTTLKRLDGIEGSAPLPLFGTHLARSRKDFPFIAVVESEKSALLLSLQMPSTLWLAAGSMEWISKHNITEKLAPFKDCKVRLLPDRNAVEHWEGIAEVAREAGFDCICCREVTEYYFPRYADGTQTAKEGEQKKLNKSDIWDAFENCLTEPIASLGKAMQRSVMRKIKADIEKNFSSFSAYPKR